MMWTRRGAWIALALFLLALPFFSPAANAARQWDSKQASQAFQDASQQKDLLDRTDPSDSAPYLACAQLFRQVYLSDPHHRHAGDAVYAEGVLYQRMADKFGLQEHYRMAVKRLRFLVSDYGGNANCPDALLRIAAIASHSLNDEASAQEAYDRLRTRYRYSQAAIARARTGAAALAPQPKAPDASPAADQAAAGLKAAPAPPALVRSIRHEPGEKSMRITIDLDAAAAYKGARLSHPDRIYFDIAHARLDGPLRNRTLAVDSEYLRAIRTAQNESGAVRIVLDVAKVGAYAVQALQDPFRITVDIDYASKPSAKAVALPKIAAPETRPAPKAITDIGSGASATPSRPQPPAPTAPAPKAEAAVVSENIVQAAPSAARKDIARLPPSAAPATAIQPPPPRDVAAAPKAPAPKAAAPTSHGDRTLTRMLGLKIGRIVLDPGHGGHDLGTVGPKGLCEKDLTLALALELKVLLEEDLGAEVFLTRSTDMFISLEERTAIANQHHADLFVSIHANSSRIRSISGVETYFLDFAKTNAEREIAARENATSSSTISDLEDLIKKIARADKSAESRELASIMQTKLVQGARKVIPATQNRGVRSAPFVVLIGANMPSILAEVAFISNPRDERLLNKKTNQKALAKALYSGIAGYMETLGTHMVRNQSKANP